MLAEKLLGNSPPVTLNSTAWGGTVSNNITAISTTSRNATALNPDFCCGPSLCTSLPERRRNAVFALRHNPLPTHKLTAMSNSTIHTSRGVARLATNVPKNQRMPPLPNKERTDASGIAADHTHEPMTTTTCATTKAAQTNDMTSES